MGKENNLKICHFNNNKLVYNNDVHVAINLLFVTLNFLLSVGMKGVFSLLNTI